MTPPQWPPSAPETWAVTAVRLPLCYAVGRGDVGARFRLAMRCRQHSSLGSRSRSAEDVITPAPPQRKSRRRECPNLLQGLIDHAYPPSVEESPRSSHPAKKLTSSRCTGPANTPRPSWPSSSASPGRLSIGLSSGSEPASRSPPDDLGEAPRRPVKEDELGWSNVGWFPAGPVAVERVTNDPHHKGLCPLTPLPSAERRITPDRRPGGRPGAADRLAGGD